MSGRPTQRYFAPGPEDEPLDLEPSAWVYGRQIVVPLSYWDRILDFARGLDAEATGRLEDQSGSAGWDDDEIDIPPEEATRTADFLGRLAEAIRVADPLVPEPTEEFPEAYYNAELARMAEAVRAVFAEAAARGEPLSAWTE